MTKYTATALGVLVIALSLTAVGYAQPVLNVQGVLQSVDCRAGSVTLTMPDGVHAFPSTRYTAIFVDSSRASLCSLSRYIGSEATVSLTPSGSQFVAGRVDIYTTAQPAPSAPAYAPPSPSAGYVPSPGPNVGYIPPPYPYTPYYAAPYCYSPYPGPYYGPGPYCNGPYAGYYYPYPAVYGPPFFFGFGIQIGRGHFFHHR